MNITERALQISRSEKRKRANKVYRFRVKGKAFHRRGRIIGRNNAGRKARGPHMGSYGRG